MMGPTVDLCPLRMLIKVFGVCVCLCWREGGAYLPGSLVGINLGFIDNHIFTYKITTGVLMEVEINSSYIPFIEY